MEVPHRLRVLFLHVLYLLTPWLKCFDLVTSVVKSHFLKESGSQPSLEERAAGPGPRCPLAVQTGAAWLLRPLVEPWASA